MLKDNIKKLAIILNDLTEEQKIAKSYLLGIIDGMDFNKTINLGREVK